LQFFQIFHHSQAILFSTFEFVVCCLVSIN
jgi:hypothetical protein